MRFFNKDVMIIPPKKHNTNNKTIEVKSLNGYDAIREKLGEQNTMNVKNPAINEKPKIKVSIGLSFKLKHFVFDYYTCWKYGSPFSKWLNVV